MVKGRRGGRIKSAAVLAVEEILKQDWPRDVPTADIEARIRAEVADLPAKILDQGRLAGQASMLGLKRSPFYKQHLTTAQRGRGQVKEPEVFLTGGEGKAAPVDVVLVGHDAGSIEPPPAPVADARVVVAKTGSEPCRAAHVPKPVVRHADLSPLTKQYGHFVEGYAGKSMSYDDIKRALNKAMPREFTRDDIKTMVDELGIVL